MNQALREYRQNLESIRDAFATQIVKAKVRFVHICLAAIMPKELYDLACQDNQLQRCEAWAKEQGYRWEEMIGETRLMKGQLVIARFQPVLEGEGEQRKCIFYANVLGKLVNVAEGNPLLN